MPSNFIHTGPVFCTTREKGWKAFDASNRSLTPSISCAAVPSGVDWEVIFSLTLRGSLLQPSVPSQLLHISNISSSIKLEGRLVIKCPHIAGRALHWVHKATRPVSFWRWSSELPPTIQTEDVLTDSNAILVCLSEECEILEWDRCLQLLLYLPWTIYLSPSPSSLSSLSHKAVGHL